MKAVGRLPFYYLPHRARVYRSTRRRRRSADRCTSATSFRSPTPTSSRASSACAEGGVLPDGLGRQRPADRAPCAELLRRPLRSVAAYDPSFSAAGASPKPPISVSRPNFIELCERLTARTKSLRSAVAVSRPVGGLVDDLRHHRQAAQRVSQLAFLHLLSAGWRISSRRPRCGTWISDGGRAGRARGSRRPAPIIASSFDNGVASRSRPHGPS